MAVRWATRPDQEVITGTIATLPGLVETSGMKPPATIVIGEVVRLREKLSWFENLPLFGQRIVVTRAREQAGTLTAMLREQGAEVIELPNHKDRTRDRLRTPRSRYREHRPIRLADIHKRQRRKVLSGAAG